MIQLTRLNNQRFAVNSDLIKFIENSPDTVMTLLSGEKIVVLETPEVVIEKVVAFRRALLAGLPMAAEMTAVAANLAHGGGERQPRQTSENPSLG